MFKTMLLAFFGLTVAGCAQPADPDEPEPLLEDDEQPLASQDDDGGDGGDGGTCAELGDYDVDVFADEILPILASEIDLNDPEGVPLTGCAAAACHGMERPDGFSLDLGDTPENNVERFACFVNLTRPRLSAILLCPANDELCTYPHPGPELFTGPDDLNYQRILAHIQASRQ